VPADDLEVSVVLPCLDEEATLAACIRAARRSLAEAGIAGEVVVADNGSTDRSQEIARAEGAQLVEVPVRGYGNALYHGFAAARGRYIVHLDADLSYEFAHIPRFVEQMRAGADLVMGSRLRGTIDPGAMPRAHRYLGTPVLTALANLFFGCRISDINCGMRGLTREAFERLGLRAGGMEFASEMIVKAAALDMRIAEIPTDLHCDGRVRRPHLRAFRDGWRHLRFLLLFCPTWLFVVPGLLATLGGMAVILAVLADVSPYAGIFTCLVALALSVIGVQTVLLGLATRGFAQLRRLRVAEGWLDRVFADLTLEKGVVVGVLLGGTGVALLAVAAARLVAFVSAGDYVPGRVDLPSTKLALLGTALAVAGAQIVFSSFFLGLFSIEPVTGDAETAARADVSLPLNLAPLRMAPRATTARAG
jgi:hypothetical protein